MALSLAQLQAQLDALNIEIGGAVSSVRFPDGREIRKRPMQELLLAKADLEDRIRTYGGSNASKSTLGQTRRGDGPCGPGFPGWGHW